MPTAGDNKIGVVFRLTISLLIRANRMFCRLMFHVTQPAAPPLPLTGPSLLVSDHASLTDPLVLFASANRPIRFLMAREFYDMPSLRWLFTLAGCIPLSRGQPEIGPIRETLRALEEGDVVGIFPEGGIVEHRKEEGYQGIGYVALKSGAPVIPVSITWNRPRPLNLFRALTTPARARVRYGVPLVLGHDTGGTREDARKATDQILQAIRDLRTAEK